MLNIVLTNTNLTLFYIYTNVFLYFIPLLFFYLYLHNQQVSLFSFNSFNKNLFLIKFFFLLFIINLAGLPPLPGFFLKLNLFIIISNNINILSIFMVVVLNFIFFFFYIKNYKKITFSKKKLTKLPSLNQCKLVLSLLIYTIFFPLFFPYISLITYSIFLF